MTSEDYPPAPEPGMPWSDELSKWYVENFGDHPNNELAVEAAALDGSETVLDIGCGSGAAVRTAAESLSSGTAIGVDPAPEMVRLAEKQSRSHSAKQRLRFVEGGAEKLPVDDAAIDVVVAVNSLHHWLDIPKGLSEVARVLRGDGRLIVVEEIFEDNERGMDSRDIREALQASDFSIVDSSERGHPGERANVFVARLTESD